MLACRAQQPAPGAAPTAAVPPATNPNASPAATSAVDPAKEAEIRKFLENTGSKETMRTALSRVLDTYRKKYPDLPADFWTQVISDSSLDDFISRLVPVYAQYYSLDDLKAINAFYQTPAGQHMRQIQPQITGATMLVGRQWGREMGAKIMSGVLAQQAKNYAAEDKNTYYTAVSTNAPASTGAAPALPPFSATNAPASTPPAAP